MKRQLLSIKSCRHLCWCCPAHDVYPNESYKNNRSKRARSRDIKKEHKYVRTVLTRNLNKNVKENNYEY
jgi:hypothetical protein